MTPDELHEKACKDGRIKEHDMPSPETLRFMERQTEINDKIFQKLEILPEIKSTLESIHEQTKLTNGKVANHEKRLGIVENEMNQVEGKMNEAKGWKDHILKGVINLLLPVLGGAILYLILQMNALTSVVALDDEQIRTIANEVANLWSE